MADRLSPAPALPDFPRWDPLIKLTHWGVALAVALNALVTEEGSAWHVWIGYALLAMLVLRLIWGFAGPAEARFASFPPSPGRALKHVGEIRRGERVAHRSHNPLGALMAYALWACLAVIVATGIAMAGPPPTSLARTEAYEAGEAGEHEAGEAYEREGAEGEDDDDGPAKEVHELAVNLLYVLIALHIAGVVFETRRSGHGLVRAMLPGRRSDLRP